MTVPQAHILVFQQLCALLSPAVFTGLLLTAVRRYAGVSVPIPAIVLAAVVSIPCFIVGSAKFWLWRVKRKAARLGAVLPPMWTDKSIGNLDTMKMLVKSWRTGFLSKLLFLTVTHPAHSNLSPPW